MATFRLERTTTVNAPIEDVFAFFSDPYNLERITPPWLRFRVVECSDHPLRLGSSIRYRLRIRGIPLRWHSRVTIWEPPSRFIDEQTRGPYRRWVHTHSFSARGGDTEMRDEVEYRMLFGALTNKLVRKDLDSIFDHRERRLSELFPPSSDSSRARG